MKKKLLSLVIAFVFTMGISVPAFAAEKEIFIKKYYPFSGEVHFNKYKTKSLRVERSQYENS